MKRKFRHFVVLLTHIFLNTVVLVSWNSQHSYTICLDFMCSSYQCKSPSPIVSLIYCLFFPGLIVCWFNYVTDCRVLKYIDASRKEVEIELSKLVKLCRWVHGKSYLSIENLKKSRQKLKKLIQKYTVRFRLPTWLCNSWFEHEHLFFFSCFHWSFLLL